MLLDDLKTVLVAAGVGVFGTTLFLQILPETPDACVAVFEYGGRAGVRRMRASPTNVVLEHPSAQVVARALDPEAVRTTIEVAYKALDGFHGTVGGCRYWITANQPPFLLRRDENERVLLAFNVSVAKTLSP